MSAWVFWLIFAIILWMLCADWLPEPKHKREAAAKAAAERATANTNEEEVVRGATEEPATTEKAA